jgi:endonuclease YncB( thermonuclease family)
MKRATVTQAHSHFRGVQVPPALDYRLPMIRKTLAAVLIVACTAGHAGTVITGRVVGIADGDTLTMLDADQRQHIIRLDGIDAPEKAQAFGQASKGHLSDLAIGRDAVAECHKVDRYRRSVCRVTVDDADLCLAQLRAGLAWVFTRYAHELTAQRRADYNDAESVARREQKGLWRDEAPLPPWEWRHR